MQKVKPDLTARRRVTTSLPAVSLGQRSHPFLPSCPFTPDAASSIFHEVMMAGRGGAGRVVQLKAPRRTSTQLFLFTEPSLLLTVVNTIALQLHTTGICVCTCLQLYSTGIYVCTCLSCTLLVYMFVHASAVHSFVAT